VEESHSVELPKDKRRPTTDQQHACNTNIPSESDYHNHPLVAHGKCLGRRACTPARSFAVSGLEALISPPFL
jgi:hypothetical protein